MTAWRHFYQRLRARPANSLSLVCTIAAVLTAGGCGEAGPELAPVVGTILLDGQPLEGALVEFQPQKPDGSPSYAATDADGTYELSFSQSRQGALIGVHTVRISTRNENEGIRERVPIEYHARSTISREVVANETNTFDFEIETPSAATTP